MAGVPAGGSGSGTYDAISGFAVKAPGWLQDLGLAYTKAGLLLFFVLFGVVCWQARRSGSLARMATALLATAGTAAAYLGSELIKSFVHEERPCRGLSVSAIIGECPPPGDWSFPSNHSTIAAAAATGLIFAWRRLTPWVVAMAVLMGFSRVFVGAHYPHDVLAGLLLGTAVAWLMQRFLVAPTATVLAKVGEYPPWGTVFGIPEPTEDDAGEDVQAEPEPTRRIPRDRVAATPRRPARPAPAAAPQRQRQPQPPVRRPRPAGHDPRTQPPRQDRIPAPRRQPPPERAPRPNTDPDRNRRNGPGNR